MFHESVAIIFARPAAQAGIVFDAHGIGSGSGVIASVVAGLRGGFVRPIVVAVHVVVIPRPGGGNHELHAVGTAIRGIIRLDRDYKVIRRWGVFRQGDLGWLKGQCQRKQR
jgi:hypothetical protein